MNATKTAGAPAKQEAAAVTRTPVGFNDPEAREAFVRRARESMAAGSRTGAIINTGDMVEKGAPTAWERVRASGAFRIAEKGFYGAVAGAGTSLGLASTYSGLLGLTLIATNIEAAAIYLAAGYLGGLASRYMVFGAAEKLGIDLLAPGRALAKRIMDSKWMQKKDAEKKTE